MSMKLQSCESWGPDEIAFFESPEALTNEIA